MLVSMATTEEVRPRNRSIRCSLMHDVVDDGLQVTRMAPDGSNAQVECCNLDCLDLSTTMDDMRVATCEQRSGCTFLEHGQKFNDLEAINKSLQMPRLAYIWGTECYTTTRLAAMLQSPTNLLTSSSRNPFLSGNSLTVGVSKDLCRRLSHQ